MQHSSDVHDRLVWEDVDSHRPVVQQLPHHHPVSDPLPVKLEELGTSVNTRHHVCISNIYNPYTYIIINFTPSRSTGPSVLFASSQRTSDRCESDNGFRSFQESMPFVTQPPLE